MTLVTIVKRANDAGYPLTRNSSLGEVLMMGLNPIVACAKCFKPGRVIDDFYCVADDERGEIWCAECKKAYERDLEEVDRMINSLEEDFEEDDSE